MYINIWYFGWSRETDDISIIAVVQSVGFRQKVGLTPVTGKTAFSRSRGTIFYAYARRPLWR